MQVWKTANGIAKGTVHHSELYHCTSHKVQHYFFSAIISLRTLSDIYEIPGFCEVVVEKPWILYVNHSNSIVKIMKQECYTTDAIVF